MLENIALIACTISALSAVTTSFRALGASKEFSRRQSDSVLRTSCRIAGHTAQKPLPQRSNLRLYMSVTIIWYALSVIFSVPYVMNKTGSERSMWLFIWISGYLLLAILIALIWKKVLKKPDRVG